jgi:monofunctional biosynthetic peptidoglycan transglycosylase
MATVTRTKRKASKGGWPRRLLRWLIGGLLLFVLVSILWVLLYRFVPPPITFTMMGDTLAGRKITKEWMPLSQIDDDMERAAIAAEDSKFCSHYGFDQDAIAEAMRRNAQGGRIRGGSTISQQTAKNAFLWQGGGYFRKGLEAWFTLLIETMWSKQRIMEVYLNLAETGIATYGVNAGAQRYFGKDASNLDRQQAARIAAVLPLPKKRDAITPRGFTRRYGNSIAARIRIVARDGLDACLRGQGGRIASEEPTEQTAPSKGKRSETPAPTPPPERIEDYIDAPDIGAPVEPEAPQPEPEPSEAPEEAPPSAEEPAEPEPEQTPQQ